MTTDAYHRCEWVAGVSLAIGTCVQGPERSVPTTSVTLAVLPFANSAAIPSASTSPPAHRGNQRVGSAQIDPAHSVKGRTLQYKGTTKTAVEIGQELSVDYLVESTLRAEGGRLRVTTTLIRVRIKEHVWSQSYDREPTSLLGLQQELSAAIARTDSAPAVARSARGPGRPADSERGCLRCVSEGTYLAIRRTPATNARAIQANRACDRARLELRACLGRLASRLRRERL